MQVNSVGAVLAIVGLVMTVLMVVLVLAGVILEAKFTFMLIGVILILLALSRLF